MAVQDSAVPAPRASEDPRDPIPEPRTALTAAHSPHGAGAAPYATDGRRPTGRINGHPEARQNEPVGRQGGRRPGPPRVCR